MSDVNNKKDPESFSPQNALEALEEIMGLLPKSKKLDALGCYNEIAVVISRLCKRAGVEDYGKSVPTSRS